MIVGAYVGSMFTPSIEGEGEERRGGSKHYNYTMIILSRLTPSVPRLH